jgi:hypothetical protein
MLGGPGIRSILKIEDAGFDGLWIADVAPVGFDDGPVVAGKA